MAEYRLAFLIIFGVIVLAVGAYVVYRFNSNTIILIVKSSDRIEEVDVNATKSIKKLTKVVESTEEKVIDIQKKLEGE